ncbi:ankyrin containing protein [Cotonvirus japonicus]|uniref:Ankyrin containing protein n=1 Tax=Cotonvirus japonicus TaxID=2811091 RepID=A0ABM7NUD3_9VIRU|nr:ankyrin containing protein [Cotonvirus japonicus]BCS83739.1 ankyrin containing protein [Cotonvirus japonicus]
MDVQKNIIFINSFNQTDDFIHHENIFEFLDNNLVSLEIVFESYEATHIKINSSTTKIYDMNKIKTFEYIMKLGIKITNPVNLILWAVFSDKFELVQHMINYFAVTKIDLAYITELSFICGKLEMAQYLFGIHPDLELDYDYILRWSCRNNQLKVIEYLIYKGWNFETCNDYVLLSASENGYIDVVQLLIFQLKLTKDLINKSIALAKRGKYNEIVVILTSDEVKERIQK